MKAIKVAEGSYWKVIEFAGRDSSRRGLWLYECKCGTRRIVKQSSLISGKSKSCGQHKGKHGHCRGYKRTAIYRAWETMMARCYNPHNASYKDYGGRGIEVEKVWHDVERFIKDTSPKPKGKTLDRPKNDENYGPNNWKWSTPKEQANNRRNTMYLTFEGKTWPVMQWAEILGWAFQTLVWRKNNGWSDKRTLSTPPEKRKWKTRIVKERSYNQ
jgi:hypothetical protein